MRKNKALASIVLGAFLSLPFPAYSRDEKAGTSDTLACQTDKECFEAGSRAYAEKAYLAAAELFKRSYALTEDKKASSILLYNIAKAYENSRNFDLAGTYYEAYVKEMPDTKDKLEVEKRLRFLEFYAKGRELCQKGEHAEGIKYMREAESFFASAEQITSFLKEDMDKCRSSQAGVYALAEEKGSIAEVQLAPSAPSNSPEKQAPESMTQAPLSVSSSALHPDIAAEDTLHQPSSSGRYALPLITGGIAGALGITGAVLNSLAEDKFSALKERCAPDCSDEEVDGLENLVKMRNAAYGAGIVAAVAAGALLAWKSTAEVPSQVEVKGRYASLRVDF